MLVSYLLLKFYSIIFQILLILVIERMFGKLKKKRKSGKARAWGDPIDLNCDQTNFSPTTPFREIPVDINNLYDVAKQKNSFDVF